MIARPAFALALGLTFALGAELLPRPLAYAASPEVSTPAWRRNGIWHIGPVTLAGEAGTFPFGPADMVFEHAADDPAFLTGTYDRENVGLAVDGNFTGVAKAKDGLRLKAIVFDSEYGRGTLDITMAPTLNRFDGTIKFAGLTPAAQGSQPTAAGKLTGVIAGTYDRFGFDDPPGPDVSDLEVRLAFTSGDKPLKAGKAATLVVFLLNHGPNAFPAGIQDLRLAFSTPGFAPVEPIQITKFKAIAGIKDFDFGLTLPAPAPLRVPIAVKDVFVLTVKFEVPESYAGHDIAIDLDLPDVHDGVPTFPAMAEKTAHVRGFGVTFKLENLDQANPIHIFVENGAFDPFGDETRVPAGGSKRMKLLDLFAGQPLTFKAGRQGNVIDECSGSVLESGCAAITYDPAQPTFLRLTCGGPC